MIIEKSDEILKTIIDIFKKEVDREIKRHPEIFTKDVLEKFQMFTVFKDELFVADLVKYKPHTTRYGKKKIIAVFEDTKYLRDEATFMATYAYSAENGIIKIHRLNILISRDVLAAEILRNIADLKSYINRIVCDAKHEVGHLIDYLTNIDGCDEEIYNERDKMESEVEQKTFKLIQELSETPRDDPEEDKEDLRKCDELYFSLPAEVRADEYGGVDRKAYLDSIHDKTSPVGHKIEITVCQE